jgi:hypothetical protein
MFCDHKLSYPEDKLVLGHYQGLDIDAGLALAAKILRQNEVSVCRLTLQDLIDNKLNSSVHQEMQHKFDESIKQHLEQVATSQDFSAEDLTPDPEYYDNNNIIDPDYGDAEITPEMGDNYLSAKLMLPKGGVMVKGCVTTQKQDRDGNPIGLANDNPIFDTQSYIVNFDNGNQTELTANMIAESLYSQYVTPMATNMFY